MQPNHYDLLGQVQDEPRAAGRVTRDAPQSRLPSGVAPTRSEDSWIEVSSQPSSSSLSSAATNDDIITTGLRVHQNQSNRYPRSRRRRLQHLAAVTTAQVEYSSREFSSSQDEYEESESEEDHVLSSSNEDIDRRPLGPPFVQHTSLLLPASDASPSSDEDDNSTALGMRISSSPFVPQPNVFSHPPVSQDPSWTRPMETHRSQPSEVSTSSRRTAIRRNSQASVRSSQRPSYQHHSPYNVISPSHHADHDAALRASLSTLLSCAAAARGLPKTDTQPPQSGPSRAPPSSFRLVSESVAMGEEVDEGSHSETGTSASHQPPRSIPHQKSVPTYSPRDVSATRVKHRSCSPKDRGASHSSKKGRRTGTTESSSAVMTWVISAGVVVLFSAISFSAGYVLGREVGKLESSTGVRSVLGDGGISSSRASAACGQEAVRGGLRRFRWSPGASGSGVIA